MVVGRRSSSAGLLVDGPCRCRLFCRTQPIRRALDAIRAALANVGVDHRGADVGVAEEFLDRSDICPGLEEVGGEGVPEGMAAGLL